MKTLFWTIVALLLGLLLTSLLLQNKEKLIIEKYFGHQSNGVFKSMVIELDEVKVERKLLDATIHLKNLKIRMCAHKYVTMDVTLVRKLKSYSFEATNIRTSHDLNLGGLKMLKEHPNSVSVIGSLNFNNGIEIIDYNVKIPGPISCSTDSSKDLNSEFFN